MRKKPFYKKSDNEPMKIGIFLSGSGTNFEALVNYKREQGIKNAEISFVFTNVPGCRGAYKAGEHGIDVVSLSSEKFFNSLGKPPGDEESRVFYDKEMLKLLEGYFPIDIIVLAGYRRKLSSVFYATFENRIINMYPGDITKEYLVKGLPASVLAIRNKEKDIRCTVYIDRVGTRFGTAILQSSPVMLEGYGEDNIEELEREIREKAEWTALPYAVFEIIANERLSEDENGILYIDGERVPDSGILL